VNKHAAHDHKILALVEWQHAVRDAIGNRFRDGGLRGTEHLDRLFHPLDRDLGHQDRGRFDRQVRRKHGEQIRMTGTLAGQGVRERDPDRSVLAANHQVDMGNLIPVTSQRFPNMH